MNWHWTTLNHILHQSTIFAPLLGHLFYRQVITTSKGVTAGAIRNGLDYIDSDSQIVRAGQVIVSRFHALQSAFGVIPPELDQAVVLKGYLVFDLLPEVHPDYFEAYTATHSFQRHYQNAIGPTRRLYLQKFKNIPIPIPSLREQELIISIWKELQGAEQHTRNMSSSMVELQNTLLERRFQQIDPTWEKHHLIDLITVGEKFTEGYHVFWSSTGEITRDHIRKRESSKKTLVLTPQPEVLDRDYLYYYLRWNKPVREVFNPENGQQNMLGTSLIHLPRLYEQRETVSILNQSEAAVESLHIEMSALKKTIRSILEIVFNNPKKLQAASQLLKNTLILLAALFMLLGDAASSIH